MSEGTRLKVVKVGNSLRVSIPKPIAEALGIKEGDTVLLKIEGGRILMIKE
jgi:putative addiction module antidote